MFTPFKFNSCQTLISLREIVDVCFEFTSENQLLNLRKYLYNGWIGYIMVGTTTYSDTFAYTFIICTFFLGWTQKIHHKWFSYADTFGVHIDHFFFPTPSNRSTIYQYVFVLAALAQAIGWKTMSKCGSIIGWRKK